MDKLHFIEGHKEMIRCKVISGINDGQLTEKLYLNRFLNMQRQNEVIKKWRILMMCLNWMFRGEIHRYIRDASS